MTLREASVIQSFPPGWDWCDLDLHDCWAMVANSVPPRLGRHIGLNLARTWTSSVPHLQGTDGTGSGSPRHAL